MQIVKPITTLFAPRLLNQLLLFIRKRVAKYFVMSLLVVFLVQLIRQKNLFASSSLSLVVILFLLFLSLGLALALLSNYLYQLGSQKEILEVVMNEKGFIIQSKTKSAQDANPKIISWDKLENIILDEKNYAFVFDQQQTSGFKISKDYLHRSDKKMINSWLPKHINLDLD